MKSQIFQRKKQERISSTIGCAQGPFLFLILVFLSGCATTYNPATGRNEAIFISTPSEVSIGNGAAAQIAKQYTLSTNISDIQRLEKIGFKIANVSDRKDLEYKFYLVDDDKVNAFTIPGGHVYVFRGLYDLLTEDELAGVLAHEIGHVAARHIVKKLQASMGYQILSTIAVLAYSSDKESRQKKAAYAGYAGATAFNLVMLGYSREDEYEADMLTVKYTTLAGYPKKSMIDALLKLKAQEKKGTPVPYIFRSHPYMDQRIIRLEEFTAD